MKKGRQCFISRKVEEMNTRISRWRGSATCRLVLISPGMRTHFRQLPPDVTTACNGVRSTRGRPLAPSRIITLTEKPTRNSPLLSVTQPAVRPAFVICLYFHALGNWHFACSVRRSCNTQATRAMGSKTWRSADSSLIEAPFERKRRDAVRYRCAYTAPTW